MNSLLVVIIVVAVVGIAVAIVYNQLVRRRIEVDNAWSQIDVQLKRRLDLIPNLVETVKGYANHEKAALEAVITARSASLAAGATPHEQAAADNALSGALRQLFALSEAYP
ncbi:MAG: LemA family protein, partial [Actinomycetota bacterium]